MATLSSVIFAGAHKYLQIKLPNEHSISTKHLWRVKKKSVYSHHTSLTLNNISTHVPTRRLNVRTDWCVRLPCIIVDPRNYFRSFHMCICHLQNVCDVSKYMRIYCKFIVTQGRVVNGKRRHAEPQGGNDHPQLFCKENLKRICQIVSNCQIMSTNVKKKLRFVNS
jgi:hypothetical protein